MEVLFNNHFKIDYPLQNKNYYNDNSSKEELKNLLLSISDYYCMYCGKNLLCDGKEEFQMDHSIEKSNEEFSQTLRHCKYNLSIICPKCNQKYKKIMLEDLKFDDFECSSSCDNMCDKFKKIYSEYICVKLNCYKLEHRPRYST